MKAQVDLRPQDKKGESRLFFFPKPGERFVPIIEHFDFDIILAGFLENRKNFGSVFGGTAGGDHRPFGFTDSRTNTPHETPELIDFFEVPVINRTGQVTNHIHIHSEFGVRYNGLILREFIVDRNQAVRLSFDKIVLLVYFISAGHVKVTSLLIILNPNFE
jgi:hypothetical protein